MAQVFPKWANAAPKYIGAGLTLFVLGAVAFVWYYFSPWYTDVGYKPVQPLPYSHKLHAGDLGMDCRYCHVGAELSAVAMVPPTQTCMNCHAMLKTESPKLAMLRASWKNAVPMAWMRIHKLPDYAYFDHSMHLRAGVGCESCHGTVSMMDVVEQKKPLSMSWCLDCHRDPGAELRPLGLVTAMHWVPPADQAERGAALRKERDLHPPTNCSGCHR